MFGQIVIYGQSEAVFLEMPVESERSSQIPRLHDLEAQTIHEADILPADGEELLQRPRAAWARFIKKVSAADHLQCPDFGGAMRIVAFMEEKRVVRAILEHLSLWDEAKPPPVPHGAPRPPLDLKYLT